MSADDNWVLATGEDDGKPMVIRFRAAPPAYARKDAYPHLLAVAWPYESPNDQGMPSDEIVAHMSQLEDLLQDAFEGARQAFLTVCVTGNGVREWQWYAQDPDETMTLVNQTLAELEPFPIEISFQDDPEWVGYSQFLELT